MYILAVSLGTSRSFDPKGRGFSILVLAGIKRQMRIRDFDAKFVEALFYRKCSMNPTFKALT